MNNETIMMNLLNTLYNDNNRQIRLLNRQVEVLQNQIFFLEENNNDIITIYNTLQDLINHTNPNDTMNRTNNTPTRSSNTNNNRTNTTNRTNNATTNRTNNTSRTTSRINRNRNYINTSNLLDSLNYSDIPYSNTPYIDNNVEYQPLFHARPRTSQSRLLSIITDFLEPINIYPSPEQVEIATRVVRYGDIINPLNISCPITLEPFEEDNEVTMIRHCSHIFITSEIQNWFRTNCRCPVCRYDIRSYNSSPIQQTPIQQTPIQQTPIQQTPIQQTPIQPIGTQQTPIQQTQSNNTNFYSEDFSGNLINTITDTIMNELLYGLDISNNITDTNLPTFYFTYRR